MSTRAYEDVSKAQNDQILKALVRTILTKVEGARNAPDDAGSRWPFELLQNATDAGPRRGRNGVRVAVGWRGSSDRPTVTFEHDGAPFTGRDLAALLYGSSNKEFGAQDTTGRFGTGFLVTHVLSTIVRIAGLIQPDDDGEPEKFQLLVDRGGDEERIRENTLACASQLLEAEPVGDQFGILPSAEFLYDSESPEPLRRGIEAFVEALPFLFSTCANLDQARVRRLDGTWETWTATEAHSIRLPDLRDAVVLERLVRVEADGVEPRLLRSMRVVADQGEAAGAVAVVECTGGPDVVMLPRPSFPRVFRRFPVRAMSAVPIQVVLDGPFDVDQERRVVHLTDAAKAHLGSAFSAAALLVEHLVIAKAQGAHLLAKVGPLPQEIAGNKDPAWWREQLLSLATRLARLPLIQTTAGPLPALSEEGPTADFPLCRLLTKGGGAELSVEALHAVLAGTTQYFPPELAIAEDWTAIAEGWQELGVANLNLVAVEAVAAHVRIGAKTWGELVDVPAPRPWLLGLFDVVGIAWEARNGVHLPVLNGLVPDQNDTLRSPGELKIDAGIPNALKDIAEALGIPAREQLVHLDLSTAEAFNGRSHLESTVELVAANTMTAADLIERCVDHLNKNVVEGKVTDDERPLLLGAARLARYLWSQHDDREAVKTWIRRLPYLTGADAVAVFSPTKRAMAPVACWNASAQPYSNAYPEGRLLHESYADEDLVNILASCDLIWTDPLIRYPAVELKEQRLKAMARVEADAEGTTVTGESFSHIALLQPEVLGHVTDRTTAKALLGLVLKYIAPRDVGWTTWRKVQGRRAGVSVEIDVRDALWVGDLVGQAWVPCLDEQGKAMKSRCTPDSVERETSILDPTWLAGNDHAVRLLSECFGFDALDLRLIGAAPNDPGLRASLRDGLAKIVEVAGGDIGALAAAAREIEDRKRYTGEVQSMRDFGLAVQAAVERALRDAGLEVEVVDRGFDFEVFVEQRAPIEDLALASFEVAGHLVEVKATTRDEVAMTPLQAQTAAQEHSRYSLCVVSMAGLDVQNLSAADMLAVVQDRARFVTDIGIDAAGTTSLIAEAKGRPVGIRNDGELRYAVRASRWVNGLTVAQWVEAL